MGGSPTFAEVLGRMYEEQGVRAVRWHRWNRHPEIEVVFFTGAAGCGEMWVQEDEFEAVREQFKGKVVFLQV